jgi:hypothetical protein
VDPPPGFEERIERLDLSLFDALPSQSLEGDRLSWLALQRAVRRALPRYTYLEIGSYLGGSIQQHLVDPKCARIYSIDRRALELPDERGAPCRYEANSTAGMLERLRGVDPDGVGKVVCFEADARDLSPASIPGPPDFCFIDGEHTREAVLSDFAFCLRVCAPNAVIAFHDDFIIHPAIRRIVEGLAKQQVPFSAWKLGGVTFAVVLRDGPAGQDAGVRRLAVQGERWLRWAPLVTLVWRLTPRWAVPLGRRAYARLLG